MTNTQEAFENTLHNICDNLRDDGIDADIGEYVNRIMQANQAHNDAVIAELVEALELAKVTFIANKMDVRNVMEVINQAIAKVKGK